MSKSTSVPESRQLSFFDTITIILTRDKTTVVDAIDGDLCQFKWYYGSDGYASREVSKRPYTIRVTHKIHRLVLERVLNRTLERVEECDHINGDRLDNRRCNLRLATSSQNKQNQKRHKSNTTGYKGVYRNKHANKKQWQAYITVLGKHCYLGGFATPEEAYAAYCEAAKHYFGEFARLE